MDRAGRAPPRRHRGGDRLARRRPAQERRRVGFLRGVRPLSDRDPDAWDPSLALAPGASLARYQAVARHALFPLDPAPEHLATPLWPLLEKGPLTLAQAAEATGAPLRALTLCVGALAKMGLLELSEP